jgi:hypothetical protein
VEAPDSASTVKIIRNFLDRIAFLFLQKGVLKTWGLLEVYVEQSEERAHV